MMHNTPKKLLINIRHWCYSIIRTLLRPIVMDILLNDIRIYGPSARLHIAKTANMSNAFLNTNSGTITVGEYSFCGQNVSIITGTHDYSLLGKDRMWKSDLREGYDITIGDGVWIGSNATILGPCIIGDNAVVGAGAVVTKDIAPNEIVAGVPAKRIAMVKNN